jgi:ADP-heptose:LPS heptosyltransferase
MALNRFGFILNKVQFRDQLNTHSVYFNQFITVNQNYNKLAMAMGAQEVKPFVFHPPLIPNPYKTKAIALNNTCSDLGDIVRKLPDHSFAFIIQHLLKHSDYQIILTGSPRDAAGIDGFLKKYFPNQPERLSNIAGQFSFKDYYSLLGHHCKAMITIDSAPFHIAVRLDLPSLSFWGPINPKQRLKFEDYNKHFYYYLKKDCSPCIHHTDVLPCGGDNICMKHMEKPDIGQKLDELLSFIK